MQWAGETDDVRRESGGDGEKEEGEGESAIKPSWFHPSMCWDSRFSTGRRWSSLRVCTQSKLKPFKRVISVHELSSLDAKIGVSLGRVFDVWGRRLLDLVSVDTSHFSRPSVISPSPPTSPPASPLLHPSSPRNHLVNHSSIIISIINSITPSSTSPSSTQSLLHQHLHHHLNHSFINISIVISIPSPTLSPSTPLSPLHHLQQTHLHLHHPSFITSVPHPASSQVKDQLYFLYIKSYRCSWFMQCKSVWTTRQIQHNESSLISISLPFSIPQKSRGKNTGQ